MFECTERTLLVREYTKTALDEDIRKIFAPSMVRSCRKAYTPFPSALFS